jgi:hypothetical protein
MQIPPLPRPRGDAQRSPGGPAARGVPSPDALFHLLWIAPDGCAIPSGSTLDKIERLCYATFSDRRLGRPTTAIPIGAQKDQRKTITGTGKIDRPHLLQHLSRHKIPSHFIPVQITPETALSLPYAILPSSHALSTIPARGSTASLALERSDGSEGTQYARAVDPPGLRSYNRPHRATPLARPSPGTVCSARPAGA